MSSASEDQRARLIGYLPDAVGLVREAYATHVGHARWGVITQLTTTKTIVRAEHDTSREPFLLMSFDTAAAILLHLGIAPNQPAECVAAYPALASTDDVTTDMFHALLLAGMTATDAAGAHHCGLSLDETFALLNMVGPDYLSAWHAAGYGEAELRAAWATDTLPSLHDLQGFAALAAVPAPTR